VIRREITGRLSDDFTITTARKTVTLRDDHNKKTMIFTKPRIYNSMTKTHLQMKKRSSEDSPQIIKNFRLSSDYLLYMYKLLTHYNMTNYPNFRLT